ncbi:hypothetical protein ACP70R_019377 [Stipagrostis hirtigluma subsp. patula]
MATLSLKRKQPSSHGAAMGSSSRSYYGTAGGVLGLGPLKPSPCDGRKRRKDKLSWVEHTFSPFYDGHLWRKYGEKTIKDSLFSRKYYKCSYFEERKCLASKKVQQQNFDDPPLFMVTYEHEHTCNVAPVPAPDVNVMVAEAEPVVASDGLVLRFGSSGGYHHRHDVWLQQEQQQHQQPVPPSQLFMMSLNASKHQLQQQPLFPCDPMTGASSSWFPADEMLSSWFPIEEAPPEPPLTNNDEDDIFLTWNSLRYGLEDHLQFGDLVPFPACVPGRLMDVHFLTWARELKERTSFCSRKQRSHFWRRRVVEIILLFLFR